MGSSSSRPADVLADSVSPDHNALSGKVVIVTGSTNGIGYETARVLAKHGAHVVLAARNSTRAEVCKLKLIEEIKSELPDAEPHFTIIHVDLSSLASVRNAANEFLYTGMPLHMLINNAGMWTLQGKYQSTADGYESHVGSNHLGHYYFTRLLLPKMRATATAEFPGRIINLTAGFHSPKLKGVEDVEKSFVHNQKSYSDLKAYSCSKLYNIYHAQTLAERESPYNILAFAVHPGAVSSHLSSDARLSLRVLKKIFSAARLMNTPNAGAATTIHCALREGKVNSGKYFTEAKVAQPRPIAKNETLRAKAMEISEKLIVQFEVKGGV